MTIQVQSPTRVDLAGGTLDCWPLYNVVDGAETTNLAIPVYSRVVLEPKTASSTIEVRVRDLNFQARFNSLNEFLLAKAPELTLVQAVVRHFRPSAGFALETQSESPVGAGLGGSSSLCISLIKAFHQWLSLPLELWPTVTLAHNIEAQILKKPTGTQDYVPALSPGLNVIHYTVAGPSLEPLAADIPALVRRMVLVYTGQPHHSGLNNWQVIKAAMEGERSTLDSLHALKEVAERVADICRKGLWQELGEAFADEYKARVQLSSGFSSSRIEALSALMRDYGTIAKICGAGGGGCVLLWTPDGAKAEVEAACRKEKYQVLDIESPSSLNSL